MQHSIFLKLGNRKLQRILRPILGLFSVIPAQGGIQSPPDWNPESVGLDSRLRGNDSPRQLERLRILALILMAAFSSAVALGQDSPKTNRTEEPQTVAESSKYTATSTSDQVEIFIDQCVKQSPHMKQFVFGQSVEGRDLIGVSIAGDHYELGDQDDRNVVLIVGNIHPGECSGKEALLELLRELAFRPDAGAHRQWLNNNVIVMVPNYNPDANDRMGVRNRPGQIGPIQGAGRRENAQELDLNRDFGKLEAPETRALVKLIDQIQPTVFADCHTTNGSKHGYTLTYDIPHNPATAAPLRDYMREKMMPALTASMAAKDQPTFYYGNFNQDQTQWFSFGHEPRYSTEYCGLRGILSILVEDYSYLGYQERILATREFVASIIDYTTEHHREIKDLLRSIFDEWQEAINSQPYRIKLSLAAKPTAFEQKVKIKGYRDGQPRDLECQHIANYVSTRATPMPFAYIIPKDHIRVIERLKMHGIEVLPISGPFKTEVEVDTIVEIKELPVQFQKHRNRTVEATRKTVQQSFEYGETIVFTKQPLGRLAAYLLESTSDDGFVFWNFFDDYLQANQPYPVIRLPDPMDVVTDASIPPVEGTLLSLDLIDGPNTLLGPTVTPAKWFGNTNLLVANFSPSLALWDARNAAFAERPALPFDKMKLQGFLVEQGIDRSQAVAATAETPMMTVNGKYAVIEHPGHAWVYWTAAQTADTALLEVGSADSHAKQAKPNPLPGLHSSMQPGELFEFNYCESKLAFVSPAGLHVLDLETRKLETVPAPTEKHLVGKLDWVYQEELYGRGNFKGYWWNPTGDEIALIMLDESPVPAFVVMDHLPIRGNSEVTNYPKAGEPLPIVKVGIWKSGDSEPSWVTLNDYGLEDLLVSRVTWSQDGELLLIQVQNREQTWLDLIAVDRAGKNSRVLFRDQTPAWIESPGDPVFISEKEFLWLSPRDGIRRIYRYNLDGKLLATLTNQDWEVRELLGIDPQKKFVYFTGAENPSEMHCHRLSLSDGNVVTITQGAGTHAVDFSDDYSLFLDRYSQADFPVETRVCQADGVILRKLNVRSDDRLEYVLKGKPEFISVETADGRSLDAMLIKPPNFSDNRQFPVLMHVYAGPQAPRARNQFGGAFYLWHQLLAQKGYVVVLLDNRSASFRNTRDAWSVHKQLAKTEMEDLEAGVQWLKRQTWVQPDRIGIWGWSYGGYMTLYALTHSQSFKLGISGAPVTDWKNYDAIYTERYMGLPRDNAKGYEESSVLPRADKLHGKLLLIHGTIDDNVHLNNSLQFVKELQDAGALFDLMLYPANRHGITQPKQAAHLRKMMTEFILNNL